jgi:hypothetical protein
VANGSITTNLNMIYTNKVKYRVKELRINTNTSRPPSVLTISKMIRRVAEAQSNFAGAVQIRGGLPNAVALPFPSLREGKEENIKHNLEVDKI